MRYSYNKITDALTQAHERYIKKNNAKVWAGNMLRKSKKKLSFALIVVLVSALSSANAAYAQVLSSSSYTILSSSVNCGGGVATSTSYAIQDSLCETVGADTSDTNAVYSTSASYAVGAGFQAMTDIPHLTVSFSDPDSNNGANTVAFGTLTTAAVASDQIGITVTTNATTGYSATMIANNAFKTGGGSAFGEVTDGTISIGGNEYGFRTSGTDGQFNATDTCIPYSTSSSCTTTAKEFAKNSSWVSSQLTTITYKAGASSTTPAGSYSHTITIIVTGTF